jgi:serine/threonine-protein kinase RsbW
VKNQDVYSTCVPSRINSIGIVVDELLKSLQGIYGVIGDCTLFELRVILNEILVNAVIHGNNEDEDKHVRINAGLSGQVLFVSVEDEGAGYDFNNICAERKPCMDSADPLEVCECGRGLMIVKSLCNNVEVNAKGNRIVIEKSLSHV